MKKIYQIIISCFLIVNILLSSVSTVMASYTSQDLAVVDGIDANAELDKKITEQLVTEMFGEPLGEGILTQEGYQYRVPAEVFSELKESLQERDKKNSEAVNELPDDYVDNSNEQLQTMLDEMQDIPQLLASGEAARKVEIVFIIDSTGSMEEEIADVKNNIAQFAKYLSEKRISVRLGLIDYGDIVADGVDSTVVHDTSYSIWMNVSQFINSLSDVSLGNGGDINETPIDALAHLTEGTIPWSSDAYKFAVLLTDAGYKTDNTHGISNMEDMIQRLCCIDVQVSAITPKTEYTTYNKLVNLTGGIQATLNGEFSATLLSYADAVIGGAQPVQDYTIRVTEQTTGTPVKGAKISWSDGFAEKTDANGLTVVTTRNNPIRSVKIVRAGYHPLVIDSLDLLSKGCIDVKLNVDEGYFESGDTIEGESPSDTETNVPVLTKSMFQNPSSGKGKVDGPSINVFGKRINLLSIELNLDLPLFENISIEHDKVEKKYEVIIGGEAKSDSGKDKDPYWKNTYQKYKSLVKIFSHKSDKEIYNQFRTLRKNAKLIKKKMNLLLPMEVDSAGYMEVSYASGDLALEGGVVFVAEADEKTLANSKFHIYGVPCFFKLVFSMEANAKFVLVTVDSKGIETGIGAFGRTRKIGIPKTKLSVTPALTGTINVGVDKLLSVGGGLRGEIEATAELPFQKFSEAVNAKLKGSFVIKMQALGFKDEVALKFAEKQIYPWNEAKKAEPLVKINQDNFTLIERPRASATPVVFSSDDTWNYYKANTYADSVPQLIKLHNGYWLMVWVDAVPEREEKNMTALYYSVSQDGQIWSKAEMVEDDGTGDFAPYLALEENGTPILVWQDSSQVYGDIELDLETRLKDIDISAAAFDVVTNTFGKTVTLENGNEIAELAIQVVPNENGADIYWIENTVNNLLLAEGNTKICRSRWDSKASSWSSVTIVVDDLENVNNFTAGKIADEPYAAYTLEGDERVYYIGQKTEEKESIASSGIPSYIQIEKGVLYWSDPAGLHSWNKSVEKLESEELASSQVTIVQDGSNRIALMYIANGMVNEMYVSIDNKGEWTSPVPLTNYKKSLGRASVILDGSTLYWAIGRTTVDETENIFESSDLVVDSYSYQEKMIVSKEAFVSDFEDTTDGMVDIFIDVYNQGLMKSKKMKACFYREGNLVGESNLYLSSEDTTSVVSKEMDGIEPGKNYLLTASYLLPKERIEHELTVHITDMDQSTIYGTASVIVPGDSPDLIVEDINVVREGETAVVRAIIKNIGKAPAENVTATMTQEGVTSTEEKSLGSLNTETSAQVTYVVSADTLVAKGPYDNKRFTITAKTTSDEKLIGDNSESVLLSPVPMTEIKMIDKDEVVLDVGKTHTFSYEIMPLNAASNTVTWMSNDVSVASIKDGVVTAVRPGTATITVLATDANGIQFTDTTDIIVTGMKDAAVTGVKLSREALELDPNETAQLTVNIFPEYAVNKSVSWIVDDLDIVSLVPSADGSSAVVKGLKEGKTNVAVRTSDGGYIDVIEVNIGNKFVFPFTDVPLLEGNWKYESVKHVCKNSIMFGISGTTLFQPDQPLTRAMFATVLYRMTGYPTVVYQNRFSDVEPGKWYSDAVLWIYHQKIAQGFSDGSFGTVVNITREQITKMLYEYAVMRGYDVSGKTSIDHFTDRYSVSHWAVGYLQWAVDAGMISGKPNGNGFYRLDPKGEVTRAECAKLLTMFMQKYQSDIK
ncbi:MAG: S-layer homology domain-containing protein [Lachnospiraceae bacterium]|nr:S-layer homology domain-containing protein [Lachnospiraceae bacterium]